MLIGQQITVVGAGIGGLAAALALARHGAQVRVLERADALREVGAGVQISPNGMAVLDALGLARTLAERSVAGEAVQLHDGLTGRRVLRLDFGALGTAQPWLFVHRADLLDCLADAARAAGVQIETGTPVAAVDMLAEGAALNLWDGRRLTAPIVIGADGVRSVVRSAQGSGAETGFTGQVAWRALVPGDGSSAPVARVFMAPGRHLVCYPLRGGRLMNIVAVQERRNWAEEGWHHADDPANLRRAFSDFTPEIRALLDRVPEVFLWGLFRHPVAPLWHSGRVALLGDAVHPTLPFLAQGACMALEDAWVLSECLAEHAEPEAAFAAYQHVRRDRCVRIVAAAGANARAYHLGGAIRPLAHAALRVGGALAPDAALKRLGWLYRHDVTRVSGHTPQRGS
jgi:salicylate hydroxylase